MTSRSASITSVSRPVPVSGVAGAPAARTPVPAGPWGCATAPTGTGAATTGATPGWVQLTTNVRRMVPVLANPTAQGSATADPELPPTDDEAATESPVEPVTASPDVKLAAAPELPPTAVPAVDPDIPEKASTGAKLATLFGAAVTTRLTRTSPVSPEEG